MHCLRFTVSNVCALTSNCVSKVQSLQFFTIAVDALYSLWVFFPVTSVISYLINLFMIFQDWHPLQYFFLHLIHYLGRSLWKRFVVIDLVSLKTQSSWPISFRLSVLKMQNITLLSEVSIQIPSFVFLLSGKNTLLSCFSHSFIALQYALKYVLVELILSF